MNYDCIVIGAGNSGLTAALTLQKKGKNVLILEKNKMPGGLSTSFKRGDFEFPAQTNNLFGYGTLENAGEIYQLFQRLGIANKITMSEIELPVHVISKTSKEEFVLPYGIENFIEKMEEYVSGSRDSMVTFFGLCEDIREGFTYLKEKGKQLNIEDFYQKYPNFIQIAPCNVKTVLEAIHMPRKAIEILSSFWINFGSGISDLSFLHFCFIVESYVKYKPFVPILTPHEISITLATEFTSLGGTIKYLTEAQEILVENNKVVGVKTENDTFACNHLIAAISPLTVYGNLIKRENVPDDALKLQNKRTLGAKEITVYLGLNKTTEELGLSHYQYFILNSLDSVTEQKKMDTVKNGNLVATILNNGVKTASRSGTSIIILNSLFFGSEFDKNVTPENYYEYKEELASFLIQEFEKSTGTQIKSSLEEIEVATPITYRRYTGHPSGITYGFQAKGFDNLLPRVLNESEEEFINGLKICGCYGSDLAGFGETYLNGETIALKTLEEWEL